MPSYKKTILTRLEIPLTISSEVPFIIDDFALALILGIRCKTLWYCIKRKLSLYKCFTIPKKNNKKRTIFNPRPVLKHLQRQLNEIILKKITMLDCVGAYVVGKSCRDNAIQHVNHKVHIAIDLKNFFPSHNRTRVRNYFKKIIGYSHFVSGLIADLCTAPEKVEGPKPYIKHIVPQGSPTSPTLCNLIAQEALDRPILKALKDTGWVYTRYSDDLCISHPDNKSHNEINAIITLIYQLIIAANYRVNKNKTKIQRYYHRQMMLGMVINSDHPNIPVDIYKRYRAILHNCIRDGFESNAIRYGFKPIEGFISHLQGKVAYFMQVNPIKATQLKNCLTNAIAIHRKNITDDSSTS